MSCLLYFDFLIMKANIIFDYKFSKTILLIYRLETEAGRIGILLMALAGYDPRGTCSVSEITED